MFYYKSMWFYSPIKFNIKLFALLFNMCCIMSKEETHCSSAMKITYSYSTFVMF